MKNRSSRKSTKPPPARKRTAASPALAPELQYKVVELSTVDEGSLERTVNDWTRKGWRFDGVQFAMRESSKRPAMAFVFFTREGPAPAARSEDEARDKLIRLSREPGADMPVAEERGDEPSAALRWIELPKERDDD